MLSPIETAVCVVLFLAGQFAFIRLLYGLDWIED